VPWLAVDVVSQDHSVLFPGIGCELLVKLSRDNHLGMRPLLFTPGSSGRKENAAAKDSYAAK
jgi:hypothetical protein